jgi:hypothetical protein
MKIDHKIKIYQQSCNIENKTSSVKNVNVSCDNLTNTVSHIENLKENA